MCDSPVLLIFVPVKDPREGPDIWDVNGPILTDQMETPTSHSDLRHSWKQHSVPSDCCEPSLGHYPCILRQIIRAIDVHSRKLKVQYNITGPQLICLGIIQTNGSYTVTKIARESHLSTSTVVGILDRLEHEDYILRERDRVDRRNWNVRLTDRATHLLKTVPPTLHDGLLNALQALPESEQVETANTLKRLLALMGAETVDPSPILETEPPYPANPTNA